MLAELRGSDWVAILSVAIPLVGAQVVLIINSFRNKKQIGEVHVLANAQHTANADRIDQLEQVLQTSNKDIPAVPKKDL